MGGPRAIAISALVHKGCSSCTSSCAAFPQHSRQMRGLPDYQNCLLLLHNFKLGVVSQLGQLGLNSCSYGYKPQCSPGQAKETPCRAQLSAAFLITEVWCLGILFPLD